jgi:hypothetical protein
MEGWLLLFISSLSLSLEIQTRSYLFQFFEASNSIYRAGYKYRRLPPAEAGEGLR